MCVSQPICFVPCGFQTSRHARLAATLVAMTVAGAAIGCGKHEPSYKDRIGTIDPATAPIVLPGAPAPQKKQ
jgi:hypothetical protein